MCGAPAGPVYLKTRSAVSSALIVNQPVCNSLEHAFHDGNGTVMVILGNTRKGVHGHLLEVGDNGGGLERVASAGASGSFGLECVNIFVKQLKGTAKIINGNGFWCRITSPAPD